MYYQDNSSITIVSAFFDINREDWGQQNIKYSRSIKEYFKYFSLLAELDNEMIIYTTSDFKDKILELRGTKPTIIIELNLQKKFKFTIQKIQKILQNESYQKRIPLDQRQNPEYQSASYVLINNLKYYFVYDAIRKKLTSNNLVAWVDFGYCRRPKTLLGITLWNHPFDPHKIHLFTIRDRNIDLSYDELVKQALKNTPFIIGGVMVSSQEYWGKFYQLTCQIQSEFLEKYIVDDDQGITLLSYARNPNLFQLNYLGKDKWFHVFRSFHQKSHFNYLKRIALFLKLIK